jgi:RNA polymerase sigma-70 factor (ECF subfamily)
MTGREIAAANARDDERAERSFEEVFRASFSEVYRMVAHLLGPGASRADVEDVTQQVFETAYKAWPRFRGASLASTWMYGVACRVVMRQLRGFVRHRRLMRAVLEAPRLEADPSTPELAVAERQRALLVWRCLMAIKPKKRVVYVMHDIEGRSAQEIAEILEVPKETVWSRLRHARAELLERIDRLEAKEVLR